MILPAADGTSRYVLGPADLTGTVVKAASVAAASEIANQPGYAVEVTLTADGTNAFNRLAARSYPSYANGSCPATNTECIEAVDLDGAVITAPTIESSQFIGILLIISPNAAGYTLVEAQQIASKINAAR